MDIGASWTRHDVNLPSRQHALVPDSLIGTLSPAFVTVVTIPTALERLVLFVGRMLTAP